MKLLVTGAGGFLGGYVIDAALAAGHDVRAVVRSKLDHAPHPRLEVVTADLRRRDGLAAAVAGVDAVVHLAAVKGGGFAEQFAGTVTTTENLLSALEGAGIQRLVHVSSFSVYDTLQIASGGTLDETSPIIDASSERDEYAHTKMLQERMIADFARREHVELVILRPGIIYGPGELWHSHLGAEINERLWIQVGSSAVVPITYVESCADAIVRAIDAPDAPGTVLNIVDDDLPTQGEYRTAVAGVLDTVPRMIPVPWTLVRLLTKACSVANRRLAGGRANPPGLFREAVVHARFKPMRYPNEAAKRVLDWRPRYDLDGALRRIGERPTEPAPR